MGLTRIEKIKVLGLLKTEIKENSEWRDCLINEAKHHNLWFSPRMTETAIDSIADCFLEEKLLIDWLKDYPESNNQQNVGVILAGNIPLVGFHDILSVWMMGHVCWIKMSSKDEFLMKAILNKLFELDTRIKEELVIEERFNKADAVIATGSNNTFRYFEYYFKDKPNLLRKNRIGIAVLNGEESQEELDSLASDAMLYFGLGCRNTAKLFLPEGYDVLKLRESFEKWSFILENGKYKSNYDYTYAIYLMNKVKFYALGPIVLLETKDLHSRIACINYEFYSDIKEVQDKLSIVGEEVQCVSSKAGISDEIAFGTPQTPRLNQYADGVNTLEFLASL